MMNDKTKRKIIETIYMNFCGGSLGIIISFLVSKYGLGVQIILGGCAAAIGEVLGYLLFVNFHEKLKPNEKDINSWLLFSYINITVVIIVIGDMITFEKYMSNLFSNFIYHFVYGAIIWSCSVGVALVSYLLQKKYPVLIASYFTLFSCLIGIMSSSFENVLVCLTLLNIIYFLSDIFIKFLFSDSFKQRIGYDKYSLGWNEFNLLDKF